MLRHFLYLDTLMLAGFLSVFEGGLSDEVTHTHSTDFDKKAGANLGVPVFGVEVGAGRSGSLGSSRSTRDTHEARFDRLLRLAKSNTEESEFLEVRPGLGLDDLSGGELVLVKCRDLQLFEAAKMTRMIRVLGPVFGGFSQIRDVARRAGVPIPETGVGDTTMEETLQLAEQLGKVELQHAFYGECDGYFKVVGDLNLDHARQAIGGTATVVGRVAEKFGEDRAYPGVVPEGTSADLVDAAAATSADVIGPGLVLHVLAIFR